ncbi:LLM class flavin-dependent oxidoreductase [Paenibacillus barcinonensis]|uniref:LLM class flavin-dependent oxidoreductase n=1 Tax=Paenibacillus barcinonensis TaxID=198119 RepID=A0A2V4V786_PAEBA|nr:LLM class flavin-dependent oxidoreductase [Paenibacillus barcinonensis]PYE48275.1 luciferase family oxidoreductase group 1 [Paenibacillus barcinonensis]QKS56878.1 LLM class flavin-dependent oxidoreductase [Paenibacillus barcinonensis]
MSIRVGILDQTPIYEGETPVDAFRHTIELARRAEQLGFYRFWVSEHHDGQHVAGSSPEVLISHLLAHTERIRLGSGGVMLQHYSPYKVAENFNVLAALGPGRIDLGIGRAPGGLPRSTQALQQGIQESASLQEKIVQVKRYIHNEPLADATHPLAGLSASPVSANPAELYVLGASVDSANMAAELGLPYVFSLFINSNTEIALEAVRVYRERFDRSRGLEPYAALAISLIVAESEEEAEELASEHKLVKIHLESGKVLTVGSVEQAEEFGRQSNEAYRVEMLEPSVIRGTKATAGQALLELQQEFAIEEMIVTTATRDFSKRIRSFELLHELLAEQGNYHFVLGSENEQEKAEAAIG